VKFAFAGTPEFAALVLRDLVEAGRRPALVLTQPDRPRGRGCRTAPQAVRLEAEKQSLQCVQVEDINDPSLAERLDHAGTQVLVIAAFGQILRRPLLDAVPCVNVHASLLPAYRGAAPIERALAAGEETVGVTIMKVTEGLDEGPWGIRSRISVGLHDDAGSVSRVLAVLGALGIDQALTAMSDGTITWREQEGASSYATKIAVADLDLDPTRGAKAVHDQVRALSPHIGARAQAGELQLKVWRTWPYGPSGLDPVPTVATPVSGIPGRLCIGADRLFVGCGEGVVEVFEVQPAGKCRMAVGAFLRGYSPRMGTDLRLK